MKSWKKYLLYAAYILIGVGILYGLSQIILAGYATSWTGFETKTLWDWMELLIIPIVLALGAFFLDRSERAIERDTANKRAELEREIAKDRQQEAAFQAYLDKMSDLLLKEKLLTTDVAEVRDVARTRTVSIMRILDKNRNNLVIQFLREAKLITDENSILNGADIARMDLQDLNFANVYLQKANLMESNLERVFFWGAHLKGANLHKVHLGNATLAGAHLEDADLREGHLEGANLGGVYLKGTNLWHSHLEGAHLEGSDLEGTNLGGVHMQGAYLKDANLEKAYMFDAKVTPEQLAQAKSLKGATMPDGTIHE